MERIIVAFCLFLFSYRYCYAENVKNLDVIWDTPSESSFGSMPLGNGDIGTNVWTEPNGDILFYISKVNAFDAGHEFPKRMFFQTRAKVVKFRFIVNKKRKL